MIAEHGIRNGLLTSVAPTGTISLLADNVSSGIEPVFALAYTRKVLQPDGSRTEEEVSDYALRLFHETFGSDAKLPAYFVTAQDLTPAEHVRMQAAVQPFVDSAISKTVNVPEDISFEAFQEVYRDAYRSGCKGCTTYRPNAITGSVLEVKPAERPAPEASPVNDLMIRSEKLTGATYKLRWPAPPSLSNQTAGSAKNDQLGNFQTAVLGSFTVLPHFPCCGACTSSANLGQTWTHVDGARPGVLPFTVLRLALIEGAAR
ncbi:MAG TPA: hypothetical protein VGC07_04135, partial [Granulicella sp.]